jgi:hypothetical protein
MVIVFAAMASSQTALMRLLGKGLTLAVLMDATVIGMLPVTGVHADCRSEQLMGPWLLAFLTRM